MDKIPGRQKAENSCKAALRVFADKTFDQWRGLPSGCKLPEIMTIFSLFNKGVSTGFLGHKKIQYRMLVLEGYLRPIRAWFEGDTLLMLDAECPELPGGGLTLMKQLGKPDVKLDFYWNVLRLKRGEWVYAKRGIILFINPGNNILLRLLVFPPTTVDDYMTRLRLDQPRRESPSG
jgi:hypothetical protein